MLTARAAAICITVHGSNFIIPNQMLKPKTAIAELSGTPARGQVSTGEVTQLGETRMYTLFAPSPDSRYLFVSRPDRPFTYNVPCGRFPQRVQIWNRSAAPGPSSRGQAGCGICLSLGSIVSAALAYVSGLMHPPCASGSLQAPAVPDANEDPGQSSATCMARNRVYLASSANWPAGG